ncbi:deaminase [Fusarium bulbicola]|nr:deaminase [Fusarium bulbicola]
MDQSSRIQTSQPGNHKAAMERALGLANNSPPKPTNFRVGALVVRLSDNSIIAEGYTLELPGNTHAEETCLLKLAEQHGTTEEKLPDVFDTPHALYTTVEPCFKRLSGKLPCVERVLRQKSWIKQVYVGVQEPETFVGENTGRKTLEDAGIEIHHVSGLEEEILKVATAGHIKS